MAALPEWRVLDFADPQEGWPNEHQRARENVAGKYPQYSCNTCNSCKNCSGFNTCSCSSSSSINSRLCWPRCKSLAPLWSWCGVIWRCILCESCVKLLLLYDVMWWVAAWSDVNWCGVKWCCVNLVWCDATRRDAMLRYLFSVNLCDVWCDMTNRFVFFVFFPGPCVGGDRGNVRGA